MAGHKGHKISCKHDISDLLTLVSYNRCVINSRRKGRKRKVKKEIYGKCKKIMTKGVALFSVAAITASMLSPSALASTKYGYTYDTDDYNVSWKAYESFNVYSEAGEKLGTCSYLVGLTREKKTNDYVLMGRQVMTPNKEKVKINKTQYGYGLSEYVSLKGTLPTLDDYKPQNKPNKDVLSFSIGADSSGASVSASYDIEHNDLDITAKCDTPSKKFHIIYDYKPSMANPAASNKYVANESIQLGAAAFHTKKDTVDFSIKYDARFGAAKNSSCSPWLIYIDYVCKATKTREYSFTVKKK